MSIQGVYLVAGLRFHPTFDSFLQAVEAALKGGIRIFQLRTKEDLSDRDHIELGLKVRALTHQYQSLFFINDRPDIAVLCDADGVHLGPDDMSVADARKIVGNRLIGASSHSWEQAQSVLATSADYLAVGPIYSTDCKKTPDTVVGVSLLKQVLAEAKIPVVAIGGINDNNLSKVAETGVPCFGLIRGIMASADVQGTASHYVQTFQTLRTREP